MIRKILKHIYYISKNIVINLGNRNIVVSYSSRIAKSTFLGQYIRIGPNSYIKGKIGSYTYIAENCRLNAEIGSFCSISPRVKIVNATHPTNMISTSPVFYSTKKQCGVTFTKEDKFKELLYSDEDSEVACRIGNDVWIGEDVLIRGGITIGDGSIIAMGAVVVSNVEPYSIYGGVPAKIIGRRFDEEEKSLLLRLTWWNKPEDWLRSNSDLFADPKSFFKETMSIDTNEVKGEFNGSGKFNNKKNKKRKN